MLAIYLGAYIFILAILWGFFLIAKHHAFRFKNFSNHVGPVTYFLMFILIVLSVIGFFMIFGLGEINPRISIDTDFDTIESYY